MFGSTAAAMLAFHTYGNDPHAMLGAAVDAWFNAYPMFEEGNISEEADECIFNKFMEHVSNWGLD